MCIRDRFLCGMAGLGLSSPTAMRGYLVRRADASTLAALQLSGLADDVWVGSQIPLHSILCRGRLAGALV
eukprot:13572269-Alexandrium_andersonii.AAC.1